MDQIDKKCVSSDPNKSLTVSYSPSEDFLSPSSSLSELRHTETDQEISEPWYEGIVVS
jgi:hypothetical protein